MTDQITPTDAEQLLKEIVLHADSWRGREVLGVKGADLPAVVDKILAEMRTYRDRHAALTAEVERLQREVEVETENGLANLENQTNALVAEREAVKAERAALTAEKQRLREALEIYADAKNWGPLTSGREVVWTGNKQSGHGYSVAREALMESSREALKETNDGK